MLFLRVAVAMVPPYSNRTLAKTGTHHEAVGHLLKLSP